MKEALLRKSPTILGFIHMGHLGGLNILLHRKVFEYQVYKYWSSSSCTCHLVNESWRKRRAFSSPILKIFSKQSSRAKSDCLTSKRQPEHSEVGPMAKKRGTKPFMKAC